jgi:hypothetical protein
VAIVCDNTSSNSGLGTTGGWVAQCNRFYKNCQIARIPCTCHVLHIGWGKGRVRLMGKLPSIKERFTHHAWNLYWLCYKEFGLQDPRFVLQPFTHCYCDRVLLCPIFC